MRLKIVFFGMFQSEKKVRSVILVSRDRLYLLDVFIIMKKAFYIKSLK